jgi:hypothetical protein
MGLSTADSKQVLCREILFKVLSLGLLRSLWFKCVFCIVFEFHHLIFFFEHFKSNCSFFLLIFLLPRPIHLLNVTIIVSHYVKMHNIQLLYYLKYTMQASIDRLSLKNQFLSEHCRICSRNLSKETH